MSRKAGTAERAVELVAGNFFFLLLDRRHAAPRGKNLVLLLAVSPSILAFTHHHNYCARRMHAAFLYLPRALQLRVLI